MEFREFPEMQPLQGGHQAGLAKMEPEPEKLMSVAVLARRLGKLATAQSQTLSEVYAFARHCCLWRHQ